MKKMNERTKIILAVVVTAILASGISVYAANVAASQINYTKKDNTQITVQEALNEIYNEYNTLTIPILTISNSTTTISTTNINFSNNDLTQKYKYFKIINSVNDSNITVQQFRGAQKSTSSNVTLVVDTQYLISDYSSIWNNIKGDGGRSSFDLYLYN